jgi:penicillin-binding protein 2
MAVAEDRRRIGTRLVGLQVGAVIVFAALGICFWTLQIVQHSKYEEMAENNHQRTLALRAPRGVMFDRNGRVLVDNRNSFTISIVREHTKDLDRTVRTAVPCGRPRSQTGQADRRSASRRAELSPIVVVEDASLAQVAAITARRLDFELPDVVVEEVPTRKYPANALAAHLFGYVGEASDTQVGDGVMQGDIIGQQGIERAYNKLLMGEDGARRVVVNSTGREMRMIDEIPPTEGRRVQLTVDYDLQKAAEDGFRNAGFNGAALIMDPRNGEVLTYTSLPSYDPNDFAAGIDRVTWASLNTDKLRPLQNRVLQGRYSPGSTFKIVVATAALEEGLVTPDFHVNCSGGATFFGRYYKCHLKGGHGRWTCGTPSRSPAMSTSTRSATCLAWTRSTSGRQKLGLAGKTGIDLPNEQESIVPAPSGS